MNPRPTRTELAALLAILLLAAALRLIAPGVTEFKRDEANLSRLALDLAQGHSLPLLGITSSVGVPNPPINVYLFAPAFLFDDSGMLAVIWVALLNVLAVGLTWALTRRYFGHIAAPLAALLAAAGPWAVMFSRKIWAQDVMAPFVVGVVFTGMLGFKEGKRWAQIAHFILLALLIQIHYSGIVMLPLSLLMLIVWKRLTPRMILMAGGLAALTLIPMLIGFWQAGLLDAQSIQNAASSLSGSGQAHPVDGTAFQLAWLLVSGDQIHAFAGPEQFRNYLAAVPVGYPFFQIIPLAAILTSIWQSWRIPSSVQGKNPLPASPMQGGGELTLVLITWLALPVLIFTWQWTPVHPHYLIPLLPAAYILCGVGIQQVVSLFSGRSRTFAMIGGITAVVIISAWQAMMIISLLRFIDSTNTPGGYSFLLNRLLVIRDSVLDRQPTDVLIISEGEHPIFDEQPAIWGVLLNRVPRLRAVDGTRSRVIPAGAALELSLDSQRLLDGPSGTYYAGGDILPTRPGDVQYRLRDVDPRAAPEYTPIDPVTFSNGAILIGYAIQPTHVLMVWVLPGAVPADYQTFVHVMGEGENRMAQLDRIVWPSAYWRAGDTLFLWFDLSVPPDARALRSGMYQFTGEAYINADVLDSAGIAAGQFAEIPLQ